MKLLKPTSLRVQITVAIIFSYILAVVKASPQTNMIRYTNKEELDKLGSGKLEATGYFEDLTRVQWPGFFLDPISTVTGVHSNIVCSLKAAVTGAASFTFENGKCSLWGSRNDTAGQMFAYRYVDYQPTDQLEEVARGKVTTASLQRNIYESSFAVDGTLTSMYHSEYLLKPWWQVDLGAERLIYQIQIFPRQDSNFWDYFHNAEVRVGNTSVTDGDFSSFTLVCPYYEVYGPGKGHLLCTKQEGIRGRFVSIQVIDENPGFVVINMVSVFALKE